MTLAGRQLLAADARHRRSRSSTRRPACGRSATLCPGQWMTEGIGFYCGIVMRWLRDALCEPEKAEAARLGVDPYVVMERAAAEVPAGSNGLLAIFSNVMDVKRWVQAVPSFVGFDVDDPTRTDRRACIRAVEEQAAFATRGHLEHPPGADGPHVLGDRLRRRWRQGHPVAADRRRRPRRHRPRPGGEGIDRARCRPVRGSRRRSLRRPRPSDPRHRARRAHLRTRPDDDRRVRRRLRALVRDLSTHPRTGRGSAWRTRCGGRPEPTPPPHRPHRSSRCPKPTAATASSSTSTCPPAIGPSS